MKILVLAAHPDDETLGCGGTISKLSADNHEIHLVTFTDGVGARSDVSSDPDRRPVLTSVCDILGIAKFHSFNFPDNEMDTIPFINVVKSIENYLKDNNFIPDTVFTHSPYCLNIDHTIVYNATMTAFRGLSHFNPIKILAYEVPSSSEWNPISRFTPNCYFDVTAFFNKKLSALKVYDSEMRKHPHPRSFKNCERLAMTFGAECGLEMAERFMILREVIT